MSGPTRFLTSNYAAKRTLLAGGSVLQNGTGGGAPALVQDASFPMSNVMEDDRQVLWNTGAAPASPFNLDLTLLASTSLTVMGVCALRAASGAAVSKIECYVQTGAYTPAGTWTLVGTINNPARDSVAIFAAANAVSIRYRFTTSGQFQTGKVFAGDAWSIASSVVSDAGTRRDTPKRAVLTYKLPAAQFAFTQGDNWRDMSVTMSQLTAAQKDSLQALADVTRAFVYVDAEDRAHDCLLASGDVPTTQTAPNPLFQCTVPLVGLP